MAQRTIQIKFRVSEEEYSAIKKEMLSRNRDSVPAFCREKSLKTPTQKQQVYESLSLKRNDLELLTIRLASLLKLMTQEGRILDKDDLDYVSEIMKETARNLVEVKELLNK